MCHRPRASARGCSLCKWTQDLRLAVCCAACLWLTAQPDPVCQAAGTTLSSTRLCVCGEPGMMPACAGAKLDGASIQQLISEHRITGCAGVPTLFTGLLQA